MSLAVNIKNGPALWHDHRPDYKLRWEDPKEVVIEDKTTVEQMRLIQQLDDEDKQTILRLIEKMLTNKKFKDFFTKNVATL